MPNRRPPRRRQYGSAPIIDYAFPKRLTNDDELLASACSYFAQLSENSSYSNASGRYPEDSEPLPIRIEEHFHQLLGTMPETPLTAVIRQVELERLEVEILLLMICGVLGMTSLPGFGRNSSTNIHSIQDLLGVGDPIRRLQILRLLSGGSNLLKRGLVHIDMQDDLCDTEVTLNMDIIEKTIQMGSLWSSVWPVDSYEDFLDRCYDLGAAMREKVDDCLRRWGPSQMSEQEVRRLDRKIERQYTIFSQTADLHPDWPIHRIRDFGQDDKLVILALISKERGHVRSEDDLFTGMGLLMTFCQDERQAHRRVRQISDKGTLISERVIQVCGGASTSGVQDETTLLNSEFELTDEFLEKIEIKRNHKKTDRARDPLYRMDQIVLAPEIRRAIDMAKAQYEHRHILFDEWNIKSVLPYGSGTTLLFAGPPGVGKTATAEALAHELGKKIIVADYSRIQDCWVGQTEKNIRRIFSEAKNADAVLFWDEADGMIYDRNQAVRGFEIMHINVLLQEIERFSGVCILATNRKPSMDKALQRRMTLILEFTKPDRAMRRSIWEKICPPELPLAADVHFDQLSELELTGGEIKNVFINAARLAASRDEEQKVVRRQDFDRAHEYLTTGAWDRDGRKRMGFV